MEVMMKMLVILLITSRYISGSDLSISDCHPCECNKSYADCSNRNLTHVPQNLPVQLKKINLSNNHIKKLSKSVNKYVHLQHLNISGNNLYVLNRYDFRSLSDLKVLDLHSNRLNLSLEVYPRGLFKHQHKLKKLILHNNSAIYPGMEYPDDCFSDLTSLEELHIDGLQNTKFGQGFGNMTSLSRLLIKGNCDIGRIVNGSFRYLRDLHYLSMAYCGIIQIDETAFTDLQAIHTLDLSNNRDLGIANAGLGLNGLKNSSIKVLKLNRLHRYQGTGILVRKTDFEFLTMTEIEELHLEENRIELFEMGVPTLLPETLKKLFMRDNMLLFGLYMLTASTLKIESAEFSGQHKSYIRPFSVEAQSHAFVMSDRFRMDSPWQESQSSSKCESLPKSYESLELDFHKIMDGPWPGNFTIPVPQNMTFLNVSFSKLTFTIYKLHFQTNILRVLDLSYNFFSRWEGPVYGLDKLEYLDLSHNYCDYLSDEIFPHLPALKVLNISSNYLGYALTADSFKGLKNLLYLILSKNKLNKLPKVIFQPLISLKHLDLSSNYLDSWDANISNVCNLMELDISNNNFQMVPENLQLQVAKHLKKHLRIHLSNNPLKCSCDTLSSLKWMKEQGDETINYNNLACTLIDGSEMEMSHLDDIILDLEKTCTSYLGVMIGILILLVLVIALSISGLGYRYRWKLRYMYYIAVNRHRGYVATYNVEHDFEFDAFVSYADDDRGFVVRDMRKMLEEPGPGEHAFRLCIHHRDFLPGEAIAANILKAINTSRKTVVILTRNFLKSYWCRYEVEMAKMESIHRGRNTLLIVVMEDIPVKDLPIDIMEVMRKDSYVEFPNDREGQEVFWRNLKRGISPTAP